MKVLNSCFGMVLVPLAAVVLVIAVTGAAAATGAARDNDNGVQGENSKIKDVDARKGKKEPSPQQENAARGKGVTARWNKLGTPEDVARPGGFIATGLPSNEVTAARQWISNNLDLLGLTASSAAGLEVVGTNPIGNGAAVLLRQRFGGLPAGLDGLIAVGVVNGNVAFASSSLSKDTGLATSASVAPEAALRTSAGDVGSTSAGSLLPDRRTAGRCSTRPRSRMFSGPGWLRCRRRRTACGPPGKSSCPRATTSAFRATSTRPTAPCSIERA